MSVLSYKKLSNETTNQILLLHSASDHVRVHHRKLRKKFESLVKNFLANRTSEHYLSFAKYPETPTEW